MLLVTSLLAVSMLIIGFLHAVVLASLVDITDGFGAIVIAPLALDWPVASSSAH